MHEMSTLELGVALGLGRTAIYDRTQGRKPFTVAEVVKMGAIFDIEPAVFLAGPVALLRSAQGSVTFRKLSQTPDVRPEARNTASVPSMPSLYLVAA